VGKARLHFFWRDQFYSSGRGGKRGKEGREKNFNDAKEKNGRKK